MLNLQEIVASESFGNLELLASQVVEGFIIGLHKSPYHGFSVEFVEHRLYNAGESKKHIDWKLYAKTDKLFIKKFEEETNLRCQILIDISASMLFPKDEEINKLNFTIYAAAAITQLLKKQRDAVGLTFFSDKIDFHSEAKLSLSNHKRIFSELSKLQENAIQEKKTKNTAEILHQLAEQIHQRSLIIIFSDMFTQDNIDEIFSALQHLRFKKHELILFHVSHIDKEQNFNFNNRPHRFIDLETNNSVKLNPNEIREYYKNKMTDFYTEIKQRCAQYKIDFIEADIEQNFSEILSAFLTKRQRLY